MPALSSAHSKAPATANELRPEQRAELAQIKEFIAARFPFDSDRQVSCHRPTVNYGQENKKKTRYLNNQVPAPLFALAGLHCRPIFSIVSTSFRGTGCVDARRKVYVCQDRGRCRDGETHGKDICSTRHTLHERQARCIVRTRVRLSFQVLSHVHILCCIHPSRPHHV